MSELQDRMLKMVIESEPRLLACDPAATGRACFALANVMGCLMGTVLEKTGEATYREALKQLFMKADEAARNVQTIAHREADNGAGSTH